MLMFKIFRNDDFTKVENAVNAYLIEHNISRESIVDFKVAYDERMTECTVSILYKVFKPVSDF